MNRQMAQLHKHQGLNVFWANFSQFDETISKEKISMEVSGPTLLFALRASRTWHLASGCGKGTCTVPEQPPPQLSTSGTQEPAKAILKDVEGKTRALHAYVWTHLGDLMEIYQSTHRQELFWHTGDRQNKARAELLILSLVWYLY